MMLIVIAAGGYLALLALILSLLSVAKRGDEDMARESAMLGWGPHRPTNRSPAQVAAAVHGALEVERVIVAVADPRDPAIGRIAACIGAPQPPGAAVRFVAAPSIGVVRGAEAELLGVPYPPRTSALWRYAHVPLALNGRLLGTVTVARRWRPFTEEDSTLIEEVALGGTRRFARRERRSQVSVGAEKRT
jgi:hypothetical protein